MSDKVFKTSKCMLDKEHRTQNVGVHIIKLIKGFYMNLKNCYI